MDTINIEININGKSYRICDADKTEPFYENPYEFIGKLHNEFLEKTQDEKMSITEIIKQSHGWFEKKLNQKIGDTEQIILKSLQGDLHGLLENDAFSSIVKEKLNLVFDSIIKPKSYDVLEVIKLLSFIESNVDSDKSISKAEKEIILVTSSIARNSLKYWDDFFSNEEKKTKKKRPFWKKFWKVVGVAAVDIGAGALGSLVGPAVGGAAAAGASKAAS